MDKFLVILLVDEVLLQKWIIELKKGFSKPLILYALDNVGQAYPFPLTRKISEISKGQIVIAGSNIYPMFSKLEEEGLIVSNIDKNDRKYYSLSEEGKEFLKKLDVTIKSFLEVISSMKV